MALGFIKEGSKVAFEGDYTLVNFKIHEPTEEFSYRWAEYELLTFDNQYLKFNGWVDSGADLLTLNKPYHFYFSYYSGFNRFKNQKETKVSVIGVDPCKVSQIKIIDNPLEINV